MRTAKHRHANRTSIAAILMLAAVGVLLMMPVVHIHKLPSVQEHTECSSCCHEHSGHMGNGLHHNGDCPLCQVWWTVYLPSAPVEAEGALCAEAHFISRPIALLTTCAADAHAPRAPPCLL